MQYLETAITVSVLFCSLYFEVFMLITYLERRQVFQGRLATDAVVRADMPGVTIIVPCFNEEKTASKTIESLLKLNYPADKLRIIAVNDGSTDGTAAVLEGYKNYPGITVIHKENGGKHTALNLGIKQATTEFVGCLDADSYANPDSLTRIVRRFQDSEVMAVVPSLHIHAARTLIQKMQKVEYLIGIFMRSNLAELNALYVTPGPFSIFRKSVFEKIGYYRNAYNTEDMEMAMRMQSRGMKIVNAHDAVVYTSSPRTVRKLYVQRVRWTSGFLHNVRDYRFMLLRRSYGHVGGFVMPMMILFTVNVLLIVALFAYNLAQSIHLWVLRWSAIGSHAFEWSWPSFNWFYLHTSVITFASLATLCIVVSFILIGSKLSHGSRTNAFEIACYAFLYSFIAPFWVMKSVANVALNRQAVWR